VKFGQVIGTVVSTHKTPGLDGVKFLIVQPLDENRQPNGEPYIAADSTRQAGPGELVFIVASREAALSLEDSFAPVDAAIVGIIDDVHAPLLSNGAGK